MSIVGILHNKPYLINEKKNEQFAVYRNDRCRSASFISAHRHKSEAMGDKTEFFLRRRKGTDQKKLKEK